MVRTDCRECVHHPQGGLCAPYQMDSDVLDWAESDSTEWGVEEGITFVIAHAPTLCPGFEAHARDATEVVTHEEGGSETQTISVTPRKRSDGPWCKQCGEPAEVVDIDWSCPRCHGRAATWDKPSSQAILDDCQCATGPWREDVSNAPDSLVLMEFVDTDNKDTWYTVLNGFEVAQFLQDHACHITRYAVIGGK